MKGNRMNSYIFTDLAYERDFDGKRKKSDNSEYEEYEKNGFKICKLCIDSEELEKKYGRSRGTYVTIFCDRIWELDPLQTDDLTELIAEELRNMMTVFLGGIPKDKTVLLAGLGNDAVTPDAIGPETVKKVTVTRHLREVCPELLNAYGGCELAAISPGVLAGTGIETVEVVLGTVKCIAPQLIIAVDALAARSCDRLASTIQISDTGICPGSGIGNQRRAIDFATLGVPVIALGVPTVVDSATLVYDALQKSGIEEPEKEIKEFLEKGRSFFVSPKECDIITERVSSLLASAIDDACGISYSGEERNKL